MLEEDFAALQEEAGQYYHRYRACFALRDFTRVIRDNPAQPRLGGFREAPGRADPEIAWDFQQYLPYIFMMHYRARAELQASQGDFESALKEAQRGVFKLRQFWRANGHPEPEANHYEVEVLETLIAELRENKPMQELSEEFRLKEALQRAIQAEEFETAAEIRDQLAALATV